MTQRGTRITLEELLIARGMVSRTHMLDFMDVIESMTAEQKVALFQQHGFLSEEEGCRALAEFYGLPFVSIEQTTFDPAALAKLSGKMAKKHAVIPFLLTNNELSVAAAGYSQQLADDLTAITGCDLHIHLSTKRHIMSAVELQYPPETSLRSIAQLAQSVENGPSSSIMIELSQTIIASAIKERASDIHIEPDREFLRIRYRVDGLLREVNRLPIEIHRPLLVRYKVMAQLDISENRRPQDGRMRLDVGQRSFDLRVSIIPTMPGEKVVIRVLDKSGVSLHLDDMNFSESIYGNVQKCVAATNGVILLTGPTGSGKTTTCYAIINHLNSIDRNIVTIENPVEYHLPVISQVQVEHELGLDFSTVLRSVLRQDPDIIFVGEIRDLETAKIATEAALTGHLVISTMHTNNAIQAVLRMVELGVAPFFVAPSIVGILGQRLSRRICAHCKQPYEASATEMKYFQPYMPESAGESLVLYKGKGCDACRGSGYYGRIALHEMVVITDTIRDRMVQSAPLTEIETLAEAAGYRPVRYDGLKKALLGFTTLEAVLRVTTSKYDYSL